MDKQTFYAELTERLLNVGLSQEFVDRHLAQFDSYFKGKTEEEIASEIKKLGDLDKVAARIKRMAEKASNEEFDNSSDAKHCDGHNEPIIVNREENEMKEDAQGITSTDNAPDNLDDDVIVFDKIPDDNADTGSEGADAHNEVHGTKRGEAVILDADGSITVAPIDPETIAQNRRKFWAIFVLALPITLSVIAATAAGFALMFFALGIIILVSIGALIFVTAAGTLVSVFGLIFGVSQMLTSVPIGLYECGVAIMIGAFALAIGILVYNFAVRFMPLVAKWLMKFVRFIIQKYRELYVNLKKECIGL